MSERGKRADARRNVERLVAAARTAFAEHGAETSLIDVARRAGVGSATLYRHFPTREALIETVYRDQIKALAAEADRLQHSAPPLEALITWLHTFAAHMSTYRGMKGLMSAVCSDEYSDLASWTRDQLSTAAGTLLSRAQQSSAIRADITPWQMLRLINGTVMANEQVGSTGGQAKQLLTIAIDGLRYQPNMPHPNDKGTRAKPRERHMDDHG
jgi:AcrR family transcriptional regulator